VDFGLAKMLPTSARTFTLCGTADYMAPEILTYQGQGPAVDLWAVRSTLPAFPLALMSHPYMRERESVCMRDVKSVYVAARVEHARSCAGLPTVSQTTASRMGPEDACWHAH